jgi:hypothetical protein
MEEPWTAEAAGLRAYFMFAEDFKRRNPAGVTFDQLGYAGLAGGGAPRQMPGIRQEGQHSLNKVLEALQTDFRNPGPSGGPRKPDGMGVSGDGLRGELLEVKTAGQKYELKVQLEGELGILRRRVNDASGIDTRWIGTGWRPVGPDQLYYRPYPDIIVSFEPTYRLNAPPGGILYETWDRRKRPQAQIAVMPDEVAKRLRDTATARSLSRVEPAAWADAFGQAHPALLPVIKAFSAALGAGLCILAIALALDPIPGDEVAAFAAAASLLSFASGGTIPKAYRAP